VERIPRLFNATTTARICTPVAAVVLYVISVSGRAYNLTTPVTMAHHELIRKILALGAFALLGFLLQRSNFRRVRGTIAGGIVIALYSYAIELGQIVFKHSWETFAMHSFDVASGLAGGALGAFVALLMTAPAARSRRIEAAAIAFAFLVLAWGFTVTYGRIE
jgi:hypothetical protein